MLSRFCAWQEVYSIDESFLGLKNPDPGLGAAICAMVERHVGVPVTVGIATSRTLAKLASRIGKDNGTGYATLDDYSGAELDELMASRDVDAVWGVAGRTKKKLAGLGIHTMLDLKRADPREICKRFSVVPQRTVHELNGIPCIPLEQERTWHPGRSGGSSRREKRSLDGFRRSRSRPARLGRLRSYRRLR